MKILHNGVREAIEKVISGVDPIRDPMEKVISGVDPIRGPMEKVSNGVDGAGKSG